MRVLSIDTSHQNGSVAIVVAHASPWRAEVLAAASARVSNAHGESLLPIVEAMMKSAGLTLAQIDLIAVGIGPGSFTGTRIGVATAKGLAIGAHKPLRGVDAFAALAADAGARFGDEVAVAIDARKSEVYLSIASVGEDDVVRVGEPLHASPLQAWGRLGHPTIPTHAIGDGAFMVPELQAIARPRIGVASPRAESIAAIAGARQLRDPIDEVDVLEPLYVRPPDITLPKHKPGMPR